MNGLAARHQKSPTSLLLFEANTKPNQHHQGFAHLERILHSRAVQRLHYSWQLYIVFSKVHGKIIVVIFFLHTSFPALLVLLKGRSTSFVHCAKWPSLGSPPTGLSLFTTMVLPWFVIASWMDCYFQKERRHSWKPLRLSPFLSWIYIDNYIRMSYWRSEVIFWQGDHK